MKLPLMSQHDSVAASSRNLASRYSLVILLLLALLTPSAVAAAKPAEPVDDVRVLIDISGSMKRTDPQNLRRPALRLFTSLLPKGANAGVWTFGQWTNMIVKHGPVNTAWKGNARKAADTISSLGLYTNIEDVMQRATWNWKQPDDKSRRSLILLTDGLVDISKDANEDNASRNRILNDILPRLQQAGVTVHTIALSSESDAPLLKQLAAATGGRAETIDSPDGLERLFLRMFEKVSKTDTLPLKGNKVSIDNSIHEATFLVFRKPGTSDTSISPPEGKPFDLKHLPAGVEWHTDKRYDLITVQNPTPGEWRINADVDPDNRVMVVTDLRMQNTQLPNDLSAGQPLLFTMQLEQEGKTIDRPDFLQFIKATLTQRSSDGDEQQWRLRDDGRRADIVANDGVFSTRLSDSLVEGEYEFILDVDGTTFKRNKRQLVNVYGQPVDAQLQPLGQNRFALTIVPYTNLIDPQSMKVNVEHVLPSGRMEKIEVPQASAAEWRVELDTNDNAGEHELTAYITGEHKNGTAIESQLGPIRFEAGNDIMPQENAPMRAPQPEVVEEPVQEAPPPVKEKKETKEKKEEPTVEQDEEEEPAAVNWWLIIGSIVVLTIMLSGMIFGGIKLWPKIKEKLNQKKKGEEIPEKAKEETPPEKPAPVEETPEPEPEPDMPDVDQAIDELLAEDELDPELDLSADDIADMDTSSSEEENTDSEPSADTDDEAQEIAEIPDDLLFPASDDSAEPSESDQAEAESDVSAEAGDSTDIETNSEASETGTADADADADADAKENTDTKAEKDKNTSD